MTYTYDASGNVVTTVGPDGVTERATYDRAGRLLEIANTESGGTLSRFTYALDAAGNRIEQTTGVGTTYDTYDALNRLTGACTAGACVPTGAAPLPCLACIAGTITRPAATISPDPSDTQTTYVYDPVGNRTSMTSYLGTTSSSYDAADRLTSSTGLGATTYAYDANGNQTAAGSTTSSYDLADRLVSATVGTTSATYTWSGDGVRLSAATGAGTATTNFLVDRNLTLPSVAIERDGTGAIVRRSLYGLGRIGIESAAGVPTYEHTDALGSVTDLTAASGTSLAWTEYGPYGAVQSAGAAAGAPTDPFGFTGQYLDTPTALYHMRARQYDPTIGRFTAVDPVTAAVGDPYVAAYVYAQNNPVRHVDPSGRDPLCAGILFFAELGPVDWAAVVACLGATALVAYAATEAGTVALQATIPQGGVIPQPKPMPRINQPWRPDPPISNNPQTGEQEPPIGSGGGGTPSGAPKWKLATAAILSAALAAAALSGHSDK